MERSRRGWASVRTPQLLISRVRRTGRPGSPVTGWARDAGIQTAAGDHLACVWQAAISGSSFGHSSSRAGPRIRRCRSPAHVSLRRTSGDHPTATERSVEHRDVHPTPRLASPIRFGFDGNRPSWMGEEQKLESGGTHDITYHQIPTWATEHR